MGMTKPSSVSKMFSGVRYRLPDLRPTCSRVPCNGAHPPNRDRERIGDSAIEFRHCARDSHQ